MNAAGNLINSNLNVINTASPPSAHAPAAVLQRSVLRVLLYYDLFQYPLSAEEIRLQSDASVAHLDPLVQALDELVSAGMVFTDGEFFSVNSDPGIFERRRAGNRNAEAVMSKAYRRAKLISAFPYVRSVCISGSLSKNYFDATTDMDFFILTEPGRLWVCRTFLVLFKKIFLLNSKKYFCVNYFIDTDELLIPDRNIFTATELVTLLPVYNYDLYRKFYDVNDWVKDFFPNTQPRIHNGALAASAPLTRTVTEKLLSGRLGEWMDQYFFTKTLSHWRKRFGHQPDREFELNMRSRRSVSKHHPQGFQFRVLRAFEKRILAFETKHGIMISIGAT